MTSRAYRENYALIKWAPIKPEPPREQEAKGIGPTVMPDIKPFVAPGYVEITSRSQLREYERRTGTRQCGELKTAADFDNSKRPHTRDQRRLEQAVKMGMDKVLGT